MKTPSISIVMPVYNASKYLVECIESVLKQTFSDFKFLIVDDGSTDNSLDIIKTFNDRRIQIIESEHDFIQSLNIGVTSSKGEYIVRMDADDIMVDNRLQIQHEFMQNNPLVDACGGWAQSFGKDEIMMQVPTIHNEIVFAMMYGNSFIHPTVMMRKSVLESSILDNDIYQLYQKGYTGAEDYKLWTELIIRGHLLANIPEVLIKYRLSDTQVTFLKSAEMKKSSLKVQNEYLEGVMNETILSDDTYYDFLNNAIELCNNEKLSLSSLKQIVGDTFFNIIQSKIGV